MPNVGIFAEVTIFLRYFGTLATFASLISEQTPTVLRLINVHMFMYSLHLLGDFVQQNH
jgi:hypothetical protein